MCEVGDVNVLIAAALCAFGIALFLLIRAARNVGRGGGG